MFYDQEPADPSLPLYPVDHQMSPALPFIQLPAPSINVPAEDEQSTLPESSEKPAKKRKKTASAKATAAEDAAESSSAAAQRKLKAGKRAEQNRAAQRAFRERKEQKLRELEEKAGKAELTVLQEQEFERVRKHLDERERLLSQQGEAQGGLSGAQVAAYEARIDQLSGDLSRALVAQKAAHQSPQAPPAALSAIAGQSSQSLENARLRAALDESKSKLEEALKAVADRDERIRGLQQLLNPGTSNAV